MRSVNHIGIPHRARVALPQVQHVTEADAATTELLGVGVVGYLQDVPLAVIGVVDDAFST